MGGMVSHVTWVEVDGLIPSKSNVSRITPPVRSSLTDLRRRVTHDHALMLLSWFVNDVAITFISAAAASAMQARSCTHASTHRFIVDAT